MSFRFASTTPPLPAVRLASFTLALLAALPLAGCGSVVIDRRPGEDTSGSGGATTTGPGEAGSGGASTTTEEGGSAPAGECDGIEASLKDPLVGGAAELLADLPFPHRLRLDEEGVFAVAYEPDLGGEHTLFRVDKATKQVTLVAGGLPILWDVAIAGGQAFLLTQDTLCEGCATGPSKIRAVSTAGGPDSLLAVLDGHETLSLVAGEGGLYSVDLATDELLFVPWAGGSFSVVAGGASTELSAGDDRVYFLTPPTAGLAEYDELTGGMSILWPNEDPMRAIRRRSGPVHWLAGSPVSKVRRLQGDVADTLLCTAQFAFDLALNDTHAFVAAAVLDTYDDTAGDGVTAIWRVPLAGGPSEMLAAGLPNTLEIEVDATHLYWITHEYEQQTYGVWRMPLPD